MILVSYIANKPRKKPDEWEIISPGFSFAGIWWTEYASESLIENIRSFSKNVWRNKKNVWWIFENNSKGFKYVFASFPAVFGSFYVLFPYGSIRK